MTKMSKFLNKKYDGLEVYKPGEQPQNMVYIKLNTNESPYPPGPKVCSAINKTELENLRLYSDPECTEVRKKLANLYNIKPENLYLSNGSDDILNFAFMAFCGDKEEAIFPEISYGFYEVFADLYKTKYTKIPMNKDFSINYKDFLNKNKMIVIANPNSPTGLSLSILEIEEILKTNTEAPVIIDEAYVDFGGESCYRLIDKYQNLLVVQTFSKSRSMAGARLGFAIGSTELIYDLNKIKYSTNPYNINRLTLTIGSAAIDENDYYMDNCGKIIKTREYTTQRLKELGLDVLPSKANFIFTKSDKISGKRLYEELKKRGILIRHFEISKISEYNRITIGTFGEMELLIKAITEIINKKER